MYYVCDLFIGEDAFTHSIPTLLIKLWCIILVN